MFFGKNAEDEKKPAAKEEVDLDNVDVHHNSNDIYFYTDVNKASILDLNKSIKTVSADLIHTSYQLGIPPIPVKIHINSPGGSLLDGLAAVDYVRNCKASVHTIIEGVAASAATLISVMGHERFINKHSYMLIHQLSNISIGKYEELVDDMENNKALMNAIKNIYLEKTKIPEKILKEVLKRDLLFDAKQCLKYGLVDKIIE